MEKEKRHRYTLYSAVFGSSPELPTSLTSNVKGGELVKNDSVRDFILQHAMVMQPFAIHVCDGSQQEVEQLLDEMTRNGMIKKLPKYENW